MSKAVQECVFTGYMVGGDAVPVSHLQYADDTILVGDATLSNGWANKAILQLFELVAGLKVNFFKSQLLGVNVDQVWLQSLAQFKKLSKWKSKLLSFGGRLVLLKSVLHSISIHFLSFFKAPKGIISHLESLFSNFLWGGDDEHRKLVWVSWVDVCREKQYGGLGLRDLRAFNFVLLGKWRWRLLVERDRLWNKVLTSLYGVPSLTSKGRRGSVSRWWLDLWSIDVCDGISWDWFSTMCVRVLGNGRNTSFWKDSWCTTTPFCVRYGRLFFITINSEATMADMCFGRGGGVEWNWRWRRPLLSFQNEVIWLTVIWSIWLARNALIFSNKMLSTLDVLEMVKLRTWKWLKARDNSFSYSFSSWAESPFVCLNFY
uniref:Ribonuclease H protein At1g65750 family n=1 Tax=Cajanus cajan TaxID=3821 RepID=A0A151S1E2_CAJCA|nr:Putative ribonuclease H protein At1g65750 family [Cajanus cajan]